MSWFSVVVQTLWALFVDRLSFVYSLSRHATQKSLQCFCWFFLCIHLAVFQMRCQPKTCGSDIVNLPICCVFLLISHWSTADETNKHVLTCFNRKGLVSVMHTISAERENRYDLDNSIYKNRTPNCNCNNIIILDRTTKRKYILQPEFRGGRRIRFGQNNISKG